MGTRAFVGRLDATDPTVAHLRYVHTDTDPGYLVPTLVTIAQVTFAGDTTVIVAALLAHTWAYLGADVTAQDTFLDGDTPIAGVGMTLGTAETQPPTTLPVAHLSDLSAQWIYLIDPHAGTLTVLSTDDPANPAAIHSFTHTAGGRR